MKSCLNRPKKAPVFAITPLFDSSHPYFAVIVARSQDELKHLKSEVGNTINKAKAKYGSYIRLDGFIRPK